MKNKKWLAMLLTVCMLGQSVSTIWAAEAGEASAASVKAESVVEEVAESEGEVIEGVPAIEVIEEEEIVDVFEPEVEAVLPLDEEETSSPTVQCTDTGEGILKLKLENYVQPANVKKIQFAVWSLKNGQDDLKWYDAKNLAYDVDLADHKDDLGEYIIHVYEAGDVMNCICKYSVTVTSIDRKSPFLSVTDVNGDEKKFSLVLNNFKKTADSEEISAAIWSTKDGQDDLKWYSMTENTDGKLAVTFDPSKHKTEGLYNLHIYERTKAGKMNCLCKSTLTITAPKAESVEAKDVDQNEGKCTLLINGLTCPSGITRVQIPVWSKSDQNDIYWYEAKKQSDGSWKATMDLTKHKGNIGTYNVHAYAHCGNGFMSFVGSTTVTFTAGDVVVTAEPKDGGFLLKTKGISIPSGTIKEIQYAVWSKENNQKDLKWFTAKYNATARTAEYDLSMSGFAAYGEYIVHCYAKTTTGKMVFLGPTGFTVEKPEGGNVEITTNSSDGSFVITVKELKGSFTEVTIPVWSKSDQSDIVWYKATKNTAGDYVVKSNISKHKYSIDTYNAHVYVTDTNGVQACVARATFKFDMKKGELQIIETKANTTYKVMISGVSVPGLKSVEFPVWSTVNGQDDLKWYQATKSGDSYVATVEVKNHKSNGEYNVHCYANDTNGKKTLLGKGTFNVTSTVSASVSCKDATASGGFKVTVKVNDSSSPVSKVSIPVWSNQNGQDDINWYNATQQSDGTWTATVKVANHKMNLGSYSIHVYTELENGVNMIAAQTTYSFNPQNLLIIEKTANGSRKVTLLNPPAGLTKVTFPTWSEANGQDDLKWYSGTKQSDGTWTATIKIANHAQVNNGAGKYQVHCYGNDTFLSSTTFSFAESEAVKNGWYYENGYKFYYKDGKKLTNLSSIIGAQGSYVAKINRTTCTVTIYANDPGGKGYIIPVIAFTCSVGLPGTPTTAGTHYTFAKYRWKELMGPSYGQYATKFTSDGIYFHSVAGKNTTSYNLNYIDYNNLGIPASHGCVRLCVRDAKWIYDNCPLGMKVIVYDSSDPGPYGKPATIKIPAGQTWDPTDPNI